jgi:hypothetical protein
MRKQESGSVLVLFLVAFFLMVCCWATLLAIGLRTIRRVHAQDTADAVALSVAVVRARALNAAGFFNAVMGPMMIQVEKGPLTTLLKGELLFHPEYSDQLDSLNSLPDHFWLVYNPFIQSAKTVKTLFGGLMTARNWYYRWLAGLQVVNVAEKVARENGMTTLVPLPPPFFNGSGDLQPLAQDSNVDIVYFGSYGPLPVPPIEKSDDPKKRDLLRLKDGRGPREITFAVKNTRGDLYAVSAARPYNEGGPMFPIHGQPLGGGDSSAVRGGPFSWIEGFSGVIQTVANKLGVTWGLSATTDYLQAWNKGWYGQLVPLNKKQSQLVLETDRD